MSVKLTFSGKDTSLAISELERLWAKGDPNAVYDRCFAEDVTFKVFVEVMSALNKTSFSPTNHYELWQALGKLLVDKPTTSTGNFLFNQRVLPGNGEATSLCASDDGMVLAYLTFAAAKLQDEGQIKGLSRTELATALERKEAIEEPRLINIIKLRPYEVRSVDVPQDSDGKSGNSFRLLGIDTDTIYAIEEKTNDQKHLYRIPLDGTPKRDCCLSFRCPDMCYHLDLRQGRFCYFDLDSVSLVETSLFGERRSSVPLPMVEGPGVESLHQLVVAPNGKDLVLTVNNRIEEQRYVFAVVRRELGAESDGTLSVQIRWFLKKDLRNAQFLTCCAYGPSFNPRGTHSEQGAFYFLDASGQVFQIESRDLEEAKGELEELDGMDVLKPFQAISTGEKSLFAQMAIARQFPIVATTSQKPSTVRIWDSARKVRLLELESPRPIDAILFAHNDQMIVTVSRYADKMWGNVAVTYLNYALLLGKPPIQLCAEDYVRIKPLMEIAPTDTDLKLLECMIKYFSTMKKADTAS